MKVLIDTNVILDVLSNRKDFVEPARKIFKLCEVRQIAGYISALSIPNVVYIMRKELDRGKIESVINGLMLIFDIIDLKSEDINKALSLEMNDYEDCIQSIQALRLKADYIITRNIKDFTNSPILAKTPFDFISMFDKT